MVIQKVCLTILLVVFAGSVVRAQELTGVVAERAKNEIIELENQKIKAILTDTNGKDDSEEWLSRVDADDIDHMGSDGNIQNKAQLLAYRRAVNIKTYRVEQSAYHGRVYGNGGKPSTVVLTYVTEVDSESNGKRSSSKSAVTDVFVNVAGAWRMVVHQVARIAHD